MKIDRLADLLFAPTSANAANLRRDGKVHGSVHVTGNSGIDALAAIVGPLPARPRRRWLPWRTFRLLVTCHRRENWSGGLDRLASALIELGRERIDIEVVLPPNPSVTERMTQLLGGQARIRLIPPMSHAATIEAMRFADLVLSDSGGMQEEAPALGVPLLVLRDKTERPEGLACGSMEMVGTDAERIVAAVRRLRRDSRSLAIMGRPAMPFGDGFAAPRIAAHCVDFLRAQDEQMESRRA